MTNKKFHLLEYIKEKESKNLFSDYYLIACQHLLPSTYVMLQYMFDLGLKKENCAFIGKCYSSSAQTVRDMQNNGIYICESSTEFHQNTSFDAQFTLNIENFVKLQISRLNLNHESKIIILDDGGELIMKSYNLLKQYKNIFAIEQTSSGYDKLCLFNKYSFPIINVARSKTKLDLESPLIAKSVTKKFMKKISSLNTKIENALIVGMGAIGQSIFNEIHQMYSTDSYDIKTCGDNFIDLKLNKYDLIVGTTGQTILTNQHYHLLKKNVVLVSASSSDREFDAVFLRKKLNTKSNIHDDILVDNIHLLNNGFPVNFCNNGLDTVPPEEIQLTTSLLLAAACQGVKNNHTNGFTTLDKALQVSIIDLYLANKSKV